MEGGLGCVLLAARKAGEQSRAGQRDHTRHEIPRLDGGRRVRAEKESPGRDKKGPTGDVESSSSSED
jgi:hypothetical protein